MSEDATSLTAEQTQDGGVERRVDRAPRDGQAGPSVGLLEDSARFSGRWNEIQQTFVDTPKQAVERADALVDEVIQELARVFADERRRLEARWAGGGEVSTEELRLTLQRYRDFFHVLLRD
jgi:hypothetical protein